MSLELSLESLYAVELKPTLLLHSLGCIFKCRSVGVGGEKHQNQELYREYKIPKHDGFWPVDFFVCTNAIQCRDSHY